MIHYTNNSLIIEMETMIPAIDHELLIKGLIAALRVALNSDEKYDKDSLPLIRLYDLLDAISPNEQQLRKGISISNA